MKGEHIKRLLCTFLILCLIPFCVVAETFDFTVNMYDAMAYEMCIPSLPKEYKTETDEKGVVTRTYTINKYVTLSFQISNNQATGFDVVCYSKDAYIDFIGVCMCASYSILPDEGETISSNMLLRFFRASSGKDTNYGFSNHSAFKLSCFDNGVLYMILRLG